jgi:hypothetical protein
MISPPAERPHYVTDVAARLIFNRARHVGCYDGINQARAGRRTDRRQTLRCCCRGLGFGGLGEPRNRDTRFPSSVVVIVVTAPMMLHGCVAALPVVTPAAIGVGIARAKVLAICIRVVLRAVAGIGDNGLRQRRGCERRPDRSGSADQCEFHLGLPNVVNVV